MTLTYNTRLAKVKVDPHAKNQGQRSNGSNRSAHTDKQMDTHTYTHRCYQTYYLPCYVVNKYYIINTRLSVKAKSRHCYILRNN